jgi:hypothetical protein
MHVTSDNGPASWPQHLSRSRTPSQSAQVMAAALHYSVVQIADRNVGVAARLDQRTLDGLAPSPEPA